MFTYVKNTTEKVSGNREIRERILQNFPDGKSPRFDPEKTRKRLSSFLTYTVEGEQIPFLKVSLYLDETPGFVTGVLKLLVGREYKTIYTSGQWGFTCYAAESLLKALDLDLQRSVEGQGWKDQFDKFAEILGSPNTSYNLTRSYNSM